MASTTQTQNFTSRTANVDICVCTYKRPSIIDTLNAIAAQQDLGDLKYRVIVADNDEAPAARADIVAASERLGLDLVYVHAPKQNISVARNACLDAAEAPWIAFIDDDETPVPGWLAALIDEAQAGGWDVVLGPVDAVYSPAAADWLRRGAFHSIRPVWVNGVIETGYTSNVLIRRAAIEALRFRLEFGRSGGEDNDFFYRLADKGSRIGFAAKALVHEPVPDQRASLGYLLKRSFRSGQTHASRLSAAGRTVPVEIVRALAKCGACLGLALLNLPSAERRHRQLVRAALHWGAVMRLAGKREIEIYG